MSKNGEGQPNVLLGGGTFTFDLLRLALVVSPGGVRIAYVLTMLTIDLLRVP